MERSDGPVPAPRRPGVPLFRRSPAEPAAGLPPLQPDTPRVADLSALLADIDALRTSLQTDLTLAAAALEAGADEIAADLVDNDLSEVRTFSARAAERLGSLAGLDAPADGERVAGDEAGSDGVPADEPVVPLRSKRRVLAGAPLLVAAAALLGFVAGVVPERVAEPQPPAAMASAAMATSFELSRLADAGAPPEQLREVAEELNDELAALVARAASDPAAAEQAMILLQTTTEVLARQGDTSVLRDVMAQARALRQQLTQALPPAPQRPGTRSVRPVRPVVVPALPRTEAEPQQRRDAGPQSPAPRPSPKPTAAPKPTPSAEPTPTATPTPAEPSPRSSQSPSGGLPGAGDLPGF